MKIPKITGTQLKIIAIACMLIDHIGMILCGENPYMRSVGRIAFPIFAFCVAEGVRYTHNRKQYFFRLFAFAVISEPCFQYALGFPGLEHLNVMWTFLLALIGILVYEKSGGGVLGIIFPGTAAIIAALLHTDYDMYGVMLVFLFYKTAYPGWEQRREFIGSRRLWWGVSAFVLMAGYALLMDIYGEGRPIAHFALLALIPIARYNGQKGKGMKWLFYIFYPAHLMLLGILAAL